MPPALSSLLERVGGPRRALIGAIGLGAAILVLVLANWAAKPTQVPAFANLPIEQAAKIDDELTKAGIPHTLANGGTEIRIAETDVARARVALAKSGNIGPDRKGLELFDSQQWGMTDIQQRIQYRRALQGELERTILEMRGVASAKVSLALNETSTFRRASDTPPSASVVVALSSGAPPSAEMVQGIQRLVSSSVSGVAVDRVAVLDESGSALSQPDDASSGGAGLSSKQLTLRREVETYLQQKAQAMLDQAVGPSNARLTVSADINFDKVQRTSQTVDPERQATSTEQKAEIVPGAEGGAGSTNSAIAYENSKTVETFEGAIGNVKRLSVSVLVNHKLVAPDSAARAAGAPAAADSSAKDSTAAAAPALVPVPRTAEELASLEALVRTAVGTDSARGDVVQIVNLPFEPADKLAPPAPPTLAETITKYQQPAMTGLGLLMVAAIGLMTLRALKPPAPVPVAPSATAIAAGAAIPLPLPGSPAAGANPLDAAAASGGGAVLIKKAAPTFQVEVGNTVLRDQTIQVIEQSPDDAARLFRVWLRDG